MCVEIWILVNFTVSILSNLLCGFNVFLFGPVWNDFAIFLFCIIMRLFVDGNHDCSSFTVLLI